MDKKILKIGLFTAFLLSLYVSVGHLAWVFSSWEGGDTTDVQVLFWTMATSMWNGYLQAFTIDGVIAFVSYTLTNRKEAGAKGFGYTIITTLVGFSWLLNWVYAKAHSPAGSTVWSGSLHVAFVVINMEWLMPILVSTSPLLAVAFTLMIDKLTGEVEDPIALKERLEAKKKLADIRKEFAPTEDEKLTGKITKSIGDAAQIANKIKDTLPTKNVSENKPEKKSLFGRLKKQKPDNLPTDSQTESGEDSAQFADNFSDDFRTADGQTADNFSDDDQTDFGRLPHSGRTTGELIADNFSDSLPTTFQTSEPPSLSPRKPLYIDFDDAVRRSGYAQDYVSKLVRDGKVQTKKSNSRKLLLSSFEEYLAKRGRQLLAESTESPDDENDRLQLVK